MQSIGSAGLQGGEGGLSTLGRCMLPTNTHRALVDSAMGAPRGPWSLSRQGAARASAVFSAKWRIHRHNFCKNVSSLAAVR
jgi:hypothetical protein